MKKTMKKVSSLLVALMFVVALMPAASFAAYTTATIKGKTVTDFGTPKNDIDQVVAGAVTLTAEQAADSDGTLVTSFVDDVTDESTIKQFTKDETIDSSAWTSKAAYANGPIADGDVFVLLDGDATNYTKIVVTVEAASGGGTEDPSKGTETITGTGDTEYINLEIYSVILPTSANLDFMIDPQGLLDIKEGETVDLDDLKGGTVISTATPKVINNSAVDIKLSIKLQGTGDATFVAFDTDTEKTVAKVTADDATNVLLYAVPSSANIVKTETDYAASSKGFIIGSTESTINFVLAAAKYEVKNDNGEYKATPKAETGSGTAIKLGGYVNGKADWTAYTGTPTKNVGVSAVFSFEKASAADSEATQVEGIPGLITAVTGTVDVTPAAPAVSGWADGKTGTTGTALTYSKAALGSKDLELGFNVVEGDTVSKLTINSAERTTSDYAVVGGKLVIKNTLASALSNTTSTPRTITFTIGTTVYTIVVTTTA